MLIEVVIALVILASAGMMLLLVMNSINRTSARNAVRNEASLDVMESEIQKVRQLTCSYPLGTSPCTPIALVSAGSGSGWTAHSNARSESLLTGGNVVAESVVADAAGRGKFRVYRYIYCVAQPVSASGSSCSRRRLRITIEPNGQGIARLLPPDGLVTREIMISSTMAQMPAVSTP